MKIYSDSSGPAGSLYIPEKSFSAQSVREAHKYLLGQDGYFICSSKNIEAADLANLKEQVIRNNFAFLSPSEMERFVTWHRKKAQRLLSKTTIAFCGTELAGIGALEEIDASCAFLSSGYGVKRAAVAALTAWRIAKAEKEGYRLMKSEIFRENNLGKKHLLRWGFQPTGESRKSKTSDRWVDLWIKELRVNK